MTVHPLFYGAWALLGALFLALQVYRSTLTRYADEKLFLDDFHVAAERKQSAIIRKITLLRPVVYVVGAVAALMTVSIVGVDVYNAIIVIIS